MARLISRVKPSRAITITCVAVAVTVLAGAWLVIRDNERPSTSVRTEAPAADTVPAVADGRSPVEPVTSATSPSPASSGAPEASSGNTSTAGAVTPGADASTSSPEGTTAEEYWTDERMADARPKPMPTPGPADPSTGPSGGNNGSSSGSGAAGQPPTTP